MKNTVIFDMDGVIFDSETLVLKSYRHIAEKFHIDNIETVMKRCIGLNYNASRILFNEFYEGRFLFEDVKPYASAYFHKYVAKHGLPVKPGVEELLIYLTTHGYKTAVASSTRIDIVKEEIDQASLTKYFSHLIGGDMIKNSKPAPDIFLEAARVLTSNPKDCYVIEDSYNGIRAAHSAGMTPLMVPDLLPATKEMTDLGATVFQSLSEVLNYMKYIAITDNTSI